LTVRNITRNTELGARIVAATTSAARRRGLLGRTGLGPGEGLWILPCEGVHTFRMKFPIDVVFLSKQHMVLKIRAEMPRSRIAVCLRAHSVLELPAGTAAAAGTQAGDQLQFCD